MKAQTAGKELVRTRQLPAPAAEVFDALTDPAKVATWFAEHAEIEPRVGGRYAFWGRYTFGAPERTDGNQVITRFEPSRALAFRWTWDGTVSEVLFELQSADTRTELTLTHTFPGHDTFPGLCSSVGDFWTTALGNLHQFLRTGKAALLPDLIDQPGQDDLQLAIDIDAPPEAVFDALTNPGLLQRWIASQPEVEPTEGGRYTYGWTHTHEGHDLPCGPTRIRRIVPNRLLETDWSHAPMSPDAFVRWELEPTERGTRLTLTHHGFLSAADRTEHVLGWAAYMMRLLETAQD